MSEYSMVNTSSLKLKGVSDSGKIKKKSKVRLDIRKVRFSCYACLKPF
uniref:Uncharacterized protein n=1 Tax=Lepeophtheirus salmonis TaxID=72036 RepID=A0A0K2TY98_LEPSM